MATAALAALLFLPAAPNAFAAVPAPLFAPSSASADWAKLNEPPIVRSRLVAINFGLLANADGSPRAADESNRTLLLNLFPDISFTAIRDRVEVDSPVSFSWIGTLDGVALGQATLVVRDGIMAGTISMPGRLFQVRYLGGGAHAVVELNPGLFPPGAEPIPVYPGSSEAAPAPGADAEPDDGSLIDVLVVYTAAARAAAGGTAAMQALIDLAKTETNTSYANSGITQRIRIVHTEEVVYTESGNIQTDLNRVQNPADGFMDNVPTLRNTHGADLVQLIVENGGGFCGIAFLMTSVSNTFSPFGYGVTARSCATGNYSFGHEMGHNMGARHDWFVDSTNNSPYTYNHGYVNVGAGWRTIMAYNDACNPAFCQRLQYWSNPNVMFNGAPMGVPEGSPSAADNRKTLNNTAFTVANFRAAINPPPEAATLISPSGTIATNLPTFTWNAVALASSYYLWVNDSTGPKFTQWLGPATVGCASGTGTCSYTPSTALAPGAGRWWIQTWNAAGYGPWSMEMGFTVSPPGAAALVSPSGTTPTTMPTYTWNAVASAASYLLWVNDNGAVAGKIAQWLGPGTVGCASGTGTCSYTPGTALAPGAGRWWIQTWNAAGYGPWSAPMDFTVAPRAATLVSPSGSIGTTMPTYTWNAVPEAASYYLWVNDSSGAGRITQWIGPGTAGCGAGTGMCAFTPPTNLATGAAAWWIQTWSPSLGYGPWSASLNFTVP